LTGYLAKGRKDGALKELVRSEQVDFHIERAFRFRCMPVADISTKTTPLRSHIATDDELELKYWTKHFGVTRDELQNVIEKVGNSASAVRKELETIRDSTRK
jgi:Protein of unknown function (DUF3606)